MMGKCWRGGELCVYREGFSGCSGDGWSCSGDAVERGRVGAGAAEDSGPVSQKPGGVLQKPAGRTTSGGDHPAWIRGRAAGIEREALDWLAASRRLRSAGGGVGGDGEAT